MPYLSLKSLTDFKKLCDVDPLCQVFIIQDNEQPCKRQCLTNTSSLFQCAGALLLAFISILQCTTVVIHQDSWVFVHSFLNYGQSLTQVLSQCPDHVS